jgi:NADH dehydrogenase
MNFVIVGAGPTGVELAGALAELKSKVLPNDYPDLDIRRMQIHLVEGSKKVLSAMSATASAKTEKYLRSLGINVWLDTLVKDFDGSVVTTNKTNFNSKTVVWAAGIEGNYPNGINIEKARGNRIIVDEYNRIKKHENIYVVGDVACIKSEKYPDGNPMLASVAMQQGGHLAKNLNGLGRKKEMKPFVYKDKGTMATIGRNKAVVDLPWFTFGGFFGWLTWMFVHLMLLVDFRSRLVVFINWVWSYLKYDKGTRLIIREFKRRNQ